MGRKGPPFRPNLPFPRREVAGDDAIMRITEHDESCLTDGKPDVTKMNPFVLTMPDNGYWRVGEKVGDAWSVGKNLKA